MVPSVLTRVTFNFSEMRIDNLSVCIRNSYLRIQSIYPILLINYGKYPQAFEFLSAAKSKLTIIWKGRLRKRIKN